MRARAGTPCVVEERAELPERSFEQGRAEDGAGRDRGAGCKVPLARSEAAAVPL